MRRRKCFPRFAPEHLERRLSPSGLAVAHVIAFEAPKPTKPGDPVPVPVTPPTTPPAPPPGDGTPPPNKPSVPGGPADPSIK